MEKYIKTNLKTRSSPNIKAYTRFIALLLHWISAFLQKSNLNLDRLKSPLARFLSASTISGSIIEDIDNKEDGRGHMVIVR